MSQGFLNICDWWWA